MTKTIISASAMFIAIVLLQPQQAAATTKYVGDLGSVKGFISSCGQGGGSATSHNGGIRCTSANGNTVTDCFVHRGDDGTLQTDNCMQDKTPARTQTRKHGSTVGAQSSAGQGLN